MSKAAELAALIGSQSALSNRNIIINGAMQVAQRGTSSTASGYGSVDRFKSEFSGVSVTHSQESLSSGGPYDSGFRYFLRATNTSTSSATSAFLQMYQYIEAQNISTNGWKANSSSSFINYSFWVRSSLAGTYFINLRSLDGTSQNFSSPVVLEAATWKKVSLSIPGNSGITIANDNGQGLFIGIAPYYGTDYTTSGHTTGAWAAYSGSNITPDYSQNWANTASATFDITGVQLELGEQATPFEHEDIGITLAKCQRYYQRIDARTSYDGLIDGMHLATSQFYGMHTFPVQMRSNPTMTGSGTFSVMSNGNDRTPDSLIVQRANVHVVQTYSALSGGNLGTAGHGGQIRAHNDADTFLDFTAEL